MLAEVKINDSTKFRISFSPQKMNIFVNSKNRVICDLPNDNLPNDDLPTRFGQKYVPNRGLPNRRLSKKKICRLGTTPATRPGVARCSLRSQTIAHPLLFYCWSLHVNVVLTLF